MVNKKNIRYLYTEAFVSEVRMEPHKAVTHYQYGIYWHLNYIMMKYCND
jgi:hypothetical protein